VIKALREGGCTVLAKVRVNDVHHVGGSPDRAAMGSRFWRQHPEWWIGTVEARGGGSPTFKTCPSCAGFHHALAYGRPFLLDYAVPEVRAYRLAIVKEILERCDVDGLTLNFIRDPHCISFPSENAPLLTEYVAECRRAVEEAVPKRGKTTPILGAIVPWDPDYCRVMGMEVEEWVGSGLLDYVSPTPNYVSEFNLTVAPWAEMASSGKCAVYPGVAGLSSCHNDVCLPQEYEQQMGGLGTSKVTHGNVRALAHGFYAEGADGVSFFNFYSECYQNLYPLPEICLPDRIEGKERGYVYMIPSLFGSDAFLQVILPRGCLARKAVTCRLHEDLKKADAHVRFKARYLDDIASLRVDVNGKEIAQSRLRLIPHEGKDFLYVTFQIEEEGLVDGDNEIGFAYRLGTPVFDRDVIVQEIEIRVVPR
jgi:hypothetical protein